MADSKIQTVTVQQDDLRALYKSGEVVSTVYPMEDSKVQKNQVMYSNERDVGLVAQYGYTNVVRLANFNSLTRNPIIEMKFTTNGANTSDIKCDYLAYHAIKEIEWQVQGTEPHKRKGPQMINDIIDMCSTQDKKEMVLSLSGRSNYRPGSVELNSATLPINTSITVYAMLPLPFADLKGKDKKKPFPLHLVQEPLEIKIQFAQVADLFSDATVAFSSARLIFEYGKLGSIENYEKPTEGNPLIYPFISKWDHEFSLAVSAINTPQSIDLNQFRKGECVEIMFHVVVNPSTGNLCNGEKLQDIELTFNGQTIWKCAGNSTAMWDIIYDDLPSTHSKRLANVKVAGAAANVSIVGVTDGSNRYLMLEGNYNNANAATGVAEADVNINLKKYLKNNNDQYNYYKIPIAEMLQKYFGEHSHQIGSDFSKQSLKLSFASQDNALTADSRLYATYKYNSGYVFTADKQVKMYY